MISDILFEAIDDANSYLDLDCYQGELLEMVSSTLSVMRAMLIVLDTPPAELQETDPMCFQAVSFLMSLKSQIPSDLK